MELNNAKRLVFEHELDDYEVYDLKVRNVLYESYNYYIFNNEFIYSFSELEYIYGGDIIWRKLNMA